jgi:hypothetical protein
MRSNDAHNNKIDKQINQIMLYKTQGLSDTGTYQKIKNDQLNSDVLQGRVIFVILVVVFLYFFAITAAHVKRSFEHETLPASLKCV